MVSLYHVIEDLAAVISDGYIILIYSSKRRERYTSFPDMVKACYDNVLRELVAQVSELAADCKCP